MNKSNRTVIVQGGNLFDGKGGPVQQGCSVLIKDGSVAALGESAEAEARRTPGIRTVDAKGKTVMPALVDAHCHISYGEINTLEELLFYTPPEFGALRAAWNCRRVLRAGVTTISEPNSLHNIGPALRDAIECGMVEGPRMITSGPALTALHGTGLSDRIRGFAALVPVDGVEAGVKEVRRQVNDGVDFIKLIGSAEATTGNVAQGGELPTFSFTELKAIVDEAHNLGRKVAVHARSGQAAADAASAGADWIFHCSFMNEKQLEIVAKSGAVILPTLTYLANMAEWGLRVGTPSLMVELSQMELKAASKILSRAREIGVPMLIGSESGFSHTPYGEWHAREMALFVKYLGYSPSEALVGMTSENARLLGMEGLGVVDLGRVGDIIVVDGDPVADIELLQDKSRIVAVIKEGQVLDTSSTHLERREMVYERVHLYARESLTFEMTRR